MAKNHETDRGKNSWKNIRRRFWRQEAKNPGALELWGEDNLKRMKSGGAPQRWANVVWKDNGQIGMAKLSCELHHVFGITGTEDGCCPDDTLIMVWPQQHAACDPDRVLDYVFIGWIE
jgi:hypothetical protein